MSTHSQPATGRARGSIETVPPAPENADPEGDGPYPETVAPLRRPAAAETRTRLVVELSRNASQLLDELTKLEDLNKTTVVNRALQVYGLMRLAQERGGEVHMSESSGAPLHRVRFI